MEELLEVEKEKLKTLCEFLFFDLYQDWATYERFEKCFQPLFNNIEINLYNTFVSIVGEKKKYITYPRFEKAYLAYKRIKENGNQNNSDLYKFFDNILNNILKSIDSYVGEHKNSTYSVKKDYTKDSEENIISFSTKRALLAKLNILNESFVSQIQVLSDIHDKIRGIILEYDDINKFELYPKDIKKKLLKGLEINLEIINPEHYKEDKKRFNKDFNFSLYRDSITHIFGTLDQTKNIITFLGFKCVSGKLMYIGIPEGESFLFGKFGKKFYNLRIEMKREEGITFFEPGFIENKRTNYYLQNDIYNNEENIFEEEYLMNLEGDKLNQSITTTMIDENIFRSQKVDEKIPGYDYKEVINQTNRNWIKNKYIKNKNKKNMTKIKTLNDAKTLYLSIKERSVSKSTYIFQEQDEKEVYLYNPLQNPLLNNNILRESKKVKNPFFYFSPKINPDIDGIQLHQSIALIPRNNKEIKFIYCKPKESTIIYNGQINENTKPKVFFKKLNFKDLKEQLTKDIYREFDEKFKEFKNGSLIPFNILNEYIPYQIDEREEKIKKETIQNKRDLKIKEIDLQIQEINNQNNNIDSKEKEIKEDIKEKSKSEGKMLNSDAAFLWSKIGKSYELFKTVIENNKNYENNKINGVFERWKLLKNQLQMRFASKLLTTIMKIIKAKDAIYKKDISLDEKIKYYKFLTDKSNEKIIDFLSKNDDKDDNDGEENLIPDKNPEFENTLENLEKQIYEIQNLFKESKEDSDKKYLKKILYYLIQQKNILIENITNKEKEKLIEELIKDSGEDFALRFRNFLGFQRKKSDWRGDMNQNENNKNKKIKKSIYESINYFENKEIPNIFLRQKKFTDKKDPEFGPEIKTLCPIKNKGLDLPNKKAIIWDLPSRVLNSDVEDWEKIEWEDYQDIRIFSKNSSPNLDNIRQGEYIGDCYFLSALGSLCGYGRNNKKYLENLVGKIHYNYKIYFVKLNINGKWKEILIDKYFPIIKKEDKDRSEFSFGSSFQKELWVSLFEKAWAKINGCYANIGCGGYCGEAFDVLTDAYTELHQIIGINDERKKELWEILKNAKYENNYVICAGTRHFGVFENLIYSSGLIGGHAYTIIKVYEDENHKYQLVKLRNPWGEKEFNGDWSDNSDKWDKLDKKLRDSFEFGEAKDDGIFYMSYKDFLYYFSIIEILKINPDYETIASCKIPKTEAYKSQLILFQILKNNKNNCQGGKAHVFINLYQKNPRIRRKNGTHFPSPVKSYIILAKRISNGKFKFIKSITGTKVHIAIEEDLEIGEIYFIFCDVNYRFVYNEIYGYNITFYAHRSIKINVNNITNTINGKNRSEILQKVLYSYYLINNNNKDKFQAEKQNSRSGVFDFFWNKKEDKIDIYKLKYYNEDFPFIILLLQYKAGEIKDTDDICFKLELNQTYKDKNMCIYNDSDASEFDLSMVKKITHDNTIVLIMGYTLGAVFSATTDIIYENKTINHPIFEGEKYLDKQKSNNICKLFKICDEKNNICILGLEYISDQMYKIHIILEGFNAIDPEYDDQKGIKGISLKKGQKKIFNLRAIAGYDKSNFSIEIKIVKNNYLLLINKK